MMRQMRSGKGMPGAGMPGIPGMPGMPGGKQAKGRAVAQPRPRRVAAGIRPNAPSRKSRRRTRSQLVDPANWNSPAEFKDLLGGGN